MTRIKGFEYVHKTNDSTERLNYDILISGDVDKADAPPGTEVWLAEQEFDSLTE